MLTFIIPRSLIISLLAILLTACGPNETGNNSQTIVNNSKIYQWNVRTVAANANIYSIPTKTSQE